MKLYKIALRKMLNTIFKGNNMEKFQARVFFDAYIDLEVEAGARWESALIARDKACIMDRDDLFNNIKLSYAFVEVDDPAEENV